MAVGYANDVQMINRDQKRRWKVEAESRERVGEREREREKEELGTVACCVVSETDGYPPACQSIRLSLCAYSLLRTDRKTDIEIYG